MSAKTKIVVLHMKELIYTLIFAGLGILLIFLLLFMFLPGKEDGESVETMRYVAGVYTSSIQFGEHAVDMQVIEDENRIQSVSMVNLDETVETMYPLMEPALENIADQVVEKQTTEGITYSADYQYTSVVLLNAIENALAEGGTLRRRDGRVEERTGKVAGSTQKTAGSTQKKQQKHTENSREYIEKWQDGIKTPGCGKYTRVLFYSSVLKELM